MHQACVCQSFVSHQDCHSISLKTRDFHNNKLKDVRAINVFPCLNRGMCRGINLVDIHYNTVPNATFWVRCTFIQRSVNKLFLLQLNHWQYLELSKLCSNKYCWNNIAHKVGINSRTFTIHPVFRASKNMFSWFWLALPMPFEFWRQRDDAFFQTKTFSSLPLSYSSFLLLFLPILSCLLSGNGNISRIIRRSSLLLFFRVSASLLTDTLEDSCRCTFFKRSGKCRCFSLLSVVLRINACRLPRLKIDTMTEQFTIEGTIKLIDRRILCWSDVGFWGSKTVIDLVGA